MYDGDDISITKDIVITQPSLKAIKEFFDEKYIADNLIASFNPHAKVDLFYNLKKDIPIC